MVSTVSLPGSDGLVVGLMLGLLVATFICVVIILVVFQSKSNDNTILDRLKVKHDKKVEHDKSYEIVVDEDDRDHEFQLSELQIRARIKTQESSKRTAQCTHPSTTTKGSNGWTRRVSCKICGALISETRITEPERTKRG